MKSLARWDVADERFYRIDYISVTDVMIGGAILGQPYGLLIDKRRARKGAITDYRHRCRR